MLFPCVQLPLLALFAAAVSAQMSSDSTDSTDSTTSTTVLTTISTTLSWTSPNATLSANASSSSGNASATTTGKYPVTTDNSCGAEVSRMCLLTGVNPCCSGNGFCGSGSDYCGGGCQPEYGNCGTNITANTTLGNPACSWAGEGTSPRCDGRCGSNFNNSICNSAAGPDDFVQFGVFGYGPCCSSEGFCGNTEAHCAAGCQSGCNGSDSASSSSSAGATVTVTASAAASSTGLANHVVVASSGGTFALVLSLLGALLAI